MQVLLPVLALSLLIVPAAGAQEAPSSAGLLRAEVLSEGLDHPWALVFMPDGRLLVTERSGQLRVINDGAVGAPITGTPDVYDQGQGGLLDVALAPDSPKVAGFI